MSKGRIVIAGALAQKRGNGGHAWVLLQYLLGFRLLGWKVLFLDALGPEDCDDGSGRRCSAEESVGVSAARDMLRQFDLAEDYLLLKKGRRVVVGSTYQRLLEDVRSSELLLNLNGFITDPELLEASPCKVFLDIDPGFFQFWHDLGHSLIPSNYDHYMTVGLNMGREGCLVPTCGIDWIATRPPIVLDQWPVVTESRRQWTSVCSWRGAFAPIQSADRKFGLRVHEFRKFLSLPRRSKQTFELALDIHKSETRDVRRLMENGWRLVSPGVVASSPELYREFIQSSAAEIMIAKNIYVAARAGWFSDRTVCYLASGKPALVQNTGIEELFDDGGGVVLFTDLEGAVEGVHRISRDYPRHARRARAIAEECFDATKVLGRLLDVTGVR